MPDRAADSKGVAGPLFRDELRRARSEAGLTQEELGARISFSPSLVAAVETGRRMPTAAFTAKCDEILKTGGLLSRLQPFVAKETNPQWFRAWVAGESEALILRIWEPLLVPGLLQTEDYARELLSQWPGVTDEELAHRLSQRMDRQAILDRDKPPELIAIFDERVLRLNVGGAPVMRQQLGRLLELGQRRNISIQVIPAAHGVHAGIVGPIVIASFADAPDLVYLDVAYGVQLLESPEEVLVTTMLFDKIRSAALPCRASAELIKEVLTEWS